MFNRLGLILSLAIGIVLLAVLPALAESVDTAWVRRYSGPGSLEDRAYAIAVDDSGDVYVTGRSSGSGTWADYATIKYHPTGDTGWLRRYNGPGYKSDQARAIVVDDSCNAYVTGESWGGLGTYQDYATIKYDPNGTKLWVRRYDEPGNYRDWARAIAVDGSANIYVTGWSAQSLEPPYNYDYATIKYYPNGDAAWVRRYNGAGNGNDFARAIAVDGSGNVYVTGWSAQSLEPPYNYDYATIKYYPNGDTVWVRRYNGPGNGNDGARAIAVDGSSNVFVTGGAVGSDTTDDYATIKYAPDGTELWVRRHNGTTWSPPGPNDRAYAIVADGSGNVYVTGTSWGVLDWDPWGCYDYATIKYDASGNQVWAKRYSASLWSADSGLAITVDDSGNVYVTGISHYFTDDYATVKYDGSGNEVWVKRYDGSENSADGAYGIIVDGSGSVYVTGYSRGSETWDDYVTIKYVQNATDVKDETENRERPSAFALSQNYPNPFNQSTKIEFTLAKSAFVSLSIYDILGRKVKTLLSEHVSSGYKSVLWDGKNDSGKDLASGIYFYQLRVEDSASGGIGDFTETKRLVLLK